MMSSSPTVQAGATLRIARSDLSDAVYEQLKIACTYTLPTRGPMPETYCALSEFEGMVSIPRGLLGKLQALFGRFGIRPSYNARTTRVELPLASLSDFAITARLYQLEIITLLVEKVQGFVVLPCGGGKTTTGVLALLQTQQAGIIVVPTVDLMTQWADTVARALGGDRSRIRLIGGGKGDDLSSLRAPSFSLSGRDVRGGEIAICVVKALHDLVRAEPARGTKFLRSAGVFLADEAHHLAADQWAYLTERCPARWRWGLTATPERGDGWTFILPLLLGSKLYELRAAQLIDMGFLFRPTIVPVRSSWKPGPVDYWWLVTCPKCKKTTKTLWAPWQEGEAVCEEHIVTTGPRGGRVRTKCDAGALPLSAKSTRDRMHWSGALSNLTADETRLELLVELVQASVDAERCTLLLIGRKAVVPGLVAAIRERSIQAEGVVSGGPGREEKIGMLKRGRTSALVATQLADEGLDVPALDAVVLGNPGRDKGKAQQRAGRACRPEGLPPIIFDVVDTGPEFESQWAARMRAYQDAYGPKCIASTQPLSLAEARKHLTSAS